MTSQAKQKYTAVVIDLYSRQVVGWSMAERMKNQVGQRRTDYGNLAT